MRDDKYIAYYLGFHLAQHDLYFDLGSASMWYADMEDWIFFHAFLPQEPNSP